MGNLTECRLHRAAPLSDSGILSSPSIKTSPLVTSYPRNVIFSHSILSQYYPRYRLLSTTYSCYPSIPGCPQGRGKHINRSHPSEFQFGLDLGSSIQTHGRGTPPTHVNSGRESVLTETQGVSPPRAVLSSSNWQRIFAQERVDPGRVHH